MRVLVTGGAGFIGGHVVDAFVADGHEVRVLDALLPAVHPAGTVPDLPAAVEFVHGDVRDPATVDRALSGVDAVCHQGAMVGLGVDVQDMPEYAGINGLGTAVLLAAMARADVGRLVLASSMVVYGEGAGTCPDHGAVAPQPRREADLRAAKGKIPNDIEQYAPDFPDALDEALEARARTSCPKEGGATAGATATTPVATMPPLTVAAVDHGVATGCA